MSKAIAKWQETFGTEPTRVIPNTEPLEKAWENMGIAFGKIQLEKQKYKKAGMTQAVVEIDTKWSEKQKELESRTMDLIGYPRVSSSAKEALKTLASEEKRFLNIYKLEEYKKIPPPNISEAIMEAKQFFDELEIWAIEDQPYVRPIKDPVVIGYITVGYSRIAYLVASWGDDINVDDLFEKTKAIS